MEKCKFCQQELDEGTTLCPHCGRDNAEVTEQETVEAVETAEAAETVETIETAPAVEETAEAPAKAKATPGKIALAVGAVVVLLALLAALIMAGINTNKPEAPAQDPTVETVPATIPEDGNPDDATCKGSYTVTDEEAFAAKDTVVATIGDQKLTNGQLQVHYWSAVNSFLSSEQGYYIMMYGGVDPEKPLDTQRCMLDETLTWQQYFLQQALNSWQTSCGLSGEAQKAGIQMTQEEQDFLAGLDTYLEETAAGFNMSVEELLMRNVGSGAGVEEFTAFQTLYTQGAGYYNSRVSEMVPTQEDLEAFFDEHAEGYAASGVTKEGEFVDVRHILVMPKADEASQEEAADSAEEATPTFSDEAWAACEQEAQAILDSWLAGEKTEESFAALANEKSEDPGSNNAGGLYENVYEGQMVEPFEKWCFDESRKEGDTGLVKTNYGYHIMYFVGGAPQWMHYAERDWRSTEIGEMLAELAENYPMTVEYGNVIIGSLKTGE